MDFSSPKVVQQGNNYHVQHGDDSGLFVQFETRAIEDEEKSRQEGRPIYKDVDFVIIHVAGDRLTVRERQVDLVGNNRTPPDHIRFPRQWEAFKAQKQQPVEGTPITEWPPVSKSLAMELKGMHIHTVEALAAVSDQNLTWLGARELREKAKAWLEKAKAGGDVSRLVAENEQLKADMAALKAQMAAMAADKPKRGRKAEADDGEDVT
jgi:hypothetical protein